MLQLFPKYVPNKPVQNMNISHIKICKFQFSGWFTIIASITASFMANHATIINSIPWPIRFWPAEVQLFFSLKMKPIHFERNLLIGFQMLNRNGVLASNSALQVSTILNLGYTSVFCGPS
jgi:hypothetical protein